MGQGEKEGSLGQARIPPRPAVLSEISFGQYLKGTFGLMDVLFIGLAVVTGWGIPQKMASR